MASRGLFYFVTAILFLAGILLIAYQRITFDIPFVPNVKNEIWTVEAKVEFEPESKKEIVVGRSKILRPELDKIRLCDLSSRPDKIAFLRPFRRS